MEKTLFEQIKYCAEMGFGVSFISSGSMLEIKVERHGVEWTSMLPKTDSHLTNERLSDVVKYGFDKVWEEVYPAK